MIKPEELQSFTENFNYKIEGYTGQLLFPSVKTRNIKVAYKQLVDNGDLPVMAQVHALDSEARIGDRANFNAIELKKLLIKEKLNLGEKISVYLDEYGGSKDDIVDYVFNDTANLISRVITRTEVANMELLSTGKMTIKENNVDITIDYGFRDENKLVLSGWSSASHDIISDLQKIKNKAKSQGWTVVRAITSSTVIGYMLNNTAIKGYWDNKVAPITEKAMLDWVENYFGIEFIATDDVYKTSAQGTSQKRFFDEKAITFLGTRGALGKGLFGFTPEELKLNNTSEKNYVTVSMWDTEDPVTTWTKASGLYIPAISNINKMFIAKVN